MKVQRTTHLDMDVSIDKKEYNYGDLVEREQGSQRTVVGAKTGGSK